MVGGCGGDDERSYWPVALCRDGINHQPGTYIGEMGDCQMRQPWDPSVAGHEATERMTLKLIRNSKEDESVQTSQSEQICQTRPLVITLLSTRVVEITSLFTLDG